MSKFPQLYINDFYRNCQFAGLVADVIGVMYYCVLKETNFKIVSTVHLPSWRTGIRQINIQNLRSIQIYFSVNIGYDNETNSLLQQNFLVCKLIIT